MNAKKVYKNEIEKQLIPNVEFKDIEEKIEVVQHKKPIWKILVPTLAGVAVAAVIVAIVIPMSSRNDSIGVNAFSLASKITPFVSEFAPSKITRAKSNDDLEKAKKEVETHLYQFDSIIMNNDSFSTEIVDSDKQDYSQKQIVNIKNLNGESESYSLYYSDVTENEKKQSNKNKETVHLKRETIYLGLAVYKETEFSFKLSLNEKETNNKSNIESNLYLYKDETFSNYVLINSFEQEHKNEVCSEYSVSDFKDNKIIDEYSISCKNDDNKSKLIINTNNLKVDIRSYQKDGDVYLEASYKDDTEKINEKFTYKKVIIDNEVSYQIVL